MTAEYWQNAEKVELEQLFAGQAREMGTLLGRDFLADHSSSVSLERDPYSVQGIAGLGEGRALGQVRALLRTPTGSVVSAKRARTPELAAVSPKRESGVWNSAKETPW